jgi:hypothetical protein
MSDHLSFDPLIGLTDYIMNYTNAVEAGNTKFLAFLPVFFQQTVNLLAQQRLHHTRTNFQAAVNMDVRDEVLIVTVNPDDWLATHVESGADEWPMVKTHLQGPKTKISKAGYRYKVIPLKVWKSVPVANTDKADYYWKKISEALTKPRYGKTRSQVNPDGTVTVRQELITSIAEAKGMYRVMQYESSMAALSKKKPTSSQHILFRTMSEKHPEKFVHPGIKPANILQDSHKIVEDGLDEKWSGFVQAELSNKGFA